MIPVLDLYIKERIREGLEVLRTRPEKFKEYFSYVPEDNLKEIEHVLTQLKIPILTGFPRKENKIPCIIVQISGEEEVPYALGEGIDENYPEEYLGQGNYLDWELSDYIRGNSQFKAQVRVEIWTDNAIMTSLLYAIVKYCLLRAKLKMTDDNFLTPKVGGGDLEPIPDYLPIFIYRKAVTLEVDYIASYHVGDLAIGDDDQFNKKTTIDDIGIVDSGY